MKSSVTFLTALASGNAIKTSIASAASPSTYTAGGINGAIGLGAMKPARTLTVSSSASAASYVAGSAITFTGTDANGRVQTETLLLTAAGGGETIVGIKGFASVVQIDVAAQANTSGAFTFGVQDVILAQVPIAIRALAAGDIKVSYANGTTDTIPALAVKETINVSPTKIFGSAATTVVGMTLIFDTK